MISERSIIKDAAITLTSALQSNVEGKSEYKEEQLEALKQLATIFQTATTKMEVNHKQRNQRVFNKSVENDRIQRVQKQPSVNIRIQPSRQVKKPISYCKELTQSIPRNHAKAVTCKNTGSSLEFRHLLKTNMAPKWQESFANELGRLAYGLSSQNIKGTNTIKFISRNDIPKQHQITYGRIVVDIKPNKNEKYRTRLTVGGNLLKYDEDTYTPTTDLTMIKLLMNSVISTQN